MLLLVDNEDSFIFNLAQLLGEVGRERGIDVGVERAERVDPERLAAEPPLGLILGPGPGEPDSAAHASQLLGRMVSVRPVLGVCLGHQILARFFGADVVRSAPVHGFAERIQHDGRGLFRGLPESFEVARYHSLSVAGASLDPGSGTASKRASQALEISARADDGTIMALRHRRLPLDGVQFHPESILSEHGRALLTNFVDAALLAERARADSNHTDPTDPSQARPTPP